MPNIKSAEKRLRQSIQRRARNRPIRSQTRNLVKTANETVAAVEDATQAIRDAVSALDRAARKGIIHPNSAARRKSRIMKRANAAA